MNASSTRSAGSAAADPGANHRLGTVALVAVIVVALDQLTKWWALEHVASEAIPVVWTLQLRVTRNTGAAFSLLAGEGVGPLLALLAVLVVAILIWQGRFLTGRVGIVALGMVLGGAIGNLVDRAARGDGILDGAVVDFIDLGWWPVFNLADAAIVVGSVGLVVTYVFLTPEVSSPDAREARDADGSTGPSDVASTMRPDPPGAP